MTSPIGGAGARPAWQQEGLPAFGVSFDVSAEEATSLTPLADVEAEKLRMLDEMGHKLSGEAFHEAALKYAKDPDVKYLYRGAMDREHWGEPDFARKYGACDFPTLLGYLVLRSGEDRPLSAPYYRADGGELAGLLGENPSKEDLRAFRSAVFRNDVDVEVQTDAVESLSARADQVPRTAVGAALPTNLLDAAAARGMAQIASQPEFQNFIKLREAVNTMTNNGSLTHALQAGENPRQVKAPDGATTTVFDTRTILEGIKACKAPDDHYHLNPEWTSICPDLKAKLTNAASETSNAAAFGVEPHAQERLQESLKKFGFDLSKMPREPYR